MYSRMMLLTCVLVGGLFAQDQSAYFNGALNGPRIRVTDAGGVNPSAVPSAFQISGTALTIEAWIYPTAFPDGIIAPNFIAGRPAPPGGVDPWNEFSLYVWHGAGVPKASFGISAGTPGTNVGLSQSDTLKLFQWTHVAGTYDGTAIRIYINGVLKGSVNTSISIGSAGVGFYIGRFLTDRFQGTIDDVRLWNVARSQGEISGAMNSTLVGNETGLKGYWKLDGTATVNSTLVTVDLTANHNDLPVQNGVSFAAFTHSTSAGGSLTLQQPTINVGSKTYDQAYTVNTPVTNSGGAPVAIFAVDAKVLAPAAVDTVTVGYKVTDEGPFLQQFFVATSAGFRSGVVAGTGTIPHDYYDAGNVQSWLAPNGRIANNVASGDAGFRFPRNSNLHAIYSAGLQIGANVSGSIRTGSASYASEFLPGNVVGGNPANPADPQFRLYKIRKGDNAANNPDYANWPVALGAPANPNGTPRLLGDETIWCVYNDLTASAHQPATLGRFNTAPLGAEVQQTVWGFSQTGDLNNTMFIRFDIINRSATTWTDANLSFWSDPDLGYYGDDFVGVDITRDMAYVYNADDNDEGVYGNQPPAIGYVMLEGGFEKPIRSFAAYSATGDPATGDPTVAQQLYNYQQGLRRDGSPYVDPTTSAPSQFPLTGDPVAGTGWVDAVAGDRRVLLTSGPKTVAPGDTVRMVVAIIAARGNDRLHSIELLRESADNIRSFYRRVYRSNSPFALTHIGDIRPDQGHQVRVEWNAHPLDVANDQNQIVGYEVYRRVDPATGAANRGEGALLRSAKVAIPPGRWELVHTATAAQLPSYSATVPTLRDSSAAQGQYFSQFLVVARTWDPDFFFETPVDSGYSVDNLPPGIPQNPGAAIQNGNVALHWSEPTDDDFAYFAVYRSTVSNFDPAGTSAYALTADHQYTDTQGDPATTYYYRISAVDHSGNKSGFSQTVGANRTVGVTEAFDVPREFTLSQNYPNPFNPTTELTFTVERNGPASLRVYNQLGQMVGQLFTQEAVAGQQYRVRFNADELPSGVYFARLESSGKVLSQKMILAK